jgi:hypothetical protein
VNAKKNANNATGNAARMILCERYADGNLVLSAVLLILWQGDTRYSIEHHKPIEHENDIEK